MRILRDLSKERFSRIRESTERSVINEKKQKLVWELVIPRDLLQGRMVVLCSYLINRIGTRKKCFYKRTTPELALKATWI